MNIFFYEYLSSINLLIFLEPIGSNYSNGKPTLFLTFLSG